MALIKCKECDKEISENSLNCPNCGNPTNKDTFNKEVSALKKVCIFGIIFLIIFIALNFVFQYWIPSHTYTSIKNGIQVEEFRL